MKNPAAYTDKEIADRTQVMDVLADNHDDFVALMKLRGMTETMPGYPAFVMSFVSGILRDEALRNDFIKSQLGR